MPTGAVLPMNLANRHFTLIVLTIIRICVSIQASTPDWHFSCTYVFANRSLTSRSAARPLTECPVSTNYVRFLGLQQVVDRARTWPRPFLNAASPSLRPQPCSFPFRPRKHIRRTHNPGLSARILPAYLPSSDRPL